MSKESDNESFARFVQQRLNSLGYLPKLSEDGWAGEKTRRAFDSLLPSKDPPPPPSASVGKFDDRTEKNLLTLDPKAVIIFRPFIKEAKEIAASHGCEYIGISGHRTWAEQDALYAQGRTKPGSIVTNAKGGQSNHNFGIAMDFGVFKDGKYLDSSNPSTADKVHKAVGVIASKYGLEWGGEWTSIKDYPHFEVRTGLTTFQKRERYSKNNSIL
jgi:peptidoglycan L-alanyl-D-glutamate endopeptidase CwlK